MIATLQLKCRDPIVSRDGRPFGAGQGNRMRLVGWPLPSVMAGSLRTVIGKAAGKDFSPIVNRELLSVAIGGPFPVADGQLYLPAPYDCVVHSERGPLRALPQEVSDGGCNWPLDGLQPVMLSQEEAPNDFKPGTPPAWWPRERYVDWLTGKKIKFDRTFLRAPRADQRTHVKLMAEVGVAEEDNLFTTAALALTHLERSSEHLQPLERHIEIEHPQPSFEDRFAEITLAVRVQADGWCGETVSGINTLHPLGGERRLVHWQTVDNDLWRCPADIAAALDRTSRVRMILVTPAIFRDGWKPGWLDEEGLGTPPESSVVLKLIGVSIQRWRAVSGWSLADLPNQPRGPKPVRRVVPAGGVYFFEVKEGTAESLAEKWLEPVSDDEQDRRDGFGLAVWGTW